MNKQELERVRAWADAKLATGEEPPSAWYQYMKLREALDAILGGVSVVTPIGSLQSAVRPGGGPRLVACSDSPETAQRHPSETPVKLPM